MISIYSMPTGPNTVLTGRSRVVSWHADLQCEMNVAWSWDALSRAGINGTVYTGPVPDTGAAGLFDYIITDQSSCDYLSLSVALLRSVTTYSDYVYYSGHGPTDPSPVVKGYTINVICTLGIGYYDTPPLAGATPSGGTGATGAWVNLQSISSSHSWPISDSDASIPAGQPVPAGPYQFDATWNLVSVGLSGTVDYQATVAEVFDPSTGRYSEAFKPGTTETFTIQRGGGGALWTVTNRTVPPGFGTGSGVTNALTGGGIGLSYVGASATSYATLLLKDQRFDTTLYPGVQLAQGCQAKCGPLYTSGSQVNPNLNDWGHIAVERCPVPTLIPGKDPSQRISYTPNTLPGTVGLGAGFSPQTVTVNIDVLAADATHEMVPTPVDVRAGNITRHLTTAGGTAATSYSFGGYTQYRNQVYQLCNTPATDSQAFPLNPAAANSGPFVQAYFHSEFAAYDASTASLPDNKQHSPPPFNSGYFFGRIGAPFDSVRFTQRGVFPLLPHPQTTALHNHAAIGGNTFPGIWENTWRTTTDPPDGYLTNSPDGLGNLRITMPAAAPTGTNPGTSVPFGAFKADMYLQATPVATTGYRYIRMTLRSLGSANQPLTLTINRGGTILPVVLNATTGADGLTASDGGWVTATVDLLNPAAWDTSIEPLTGGNPIDAVSQLSTVVITGVALGTTYEISAIEGVLEHDAFACTPLGTFGPALFTDGITSLYPCNSAKLPPLEGHPCYAIQDYVAWTTFFNATTTAFTGPFWTLTELAPLTSGKTGYGPLSGLFQNDLWAKGLGGSGILDTSGTSAGTYAQNVILPVSLDAGNNATLTMQAQILVPQMSLYSGCGDAMNLGASAYGNQTTIRFAAQSRVPLTGCEPSAHPSAVTMTEKVSGASNPGGTSRAASGFFHSTGPGLLTGTAINATNAPLVDVTTAAGLSRTICFPELQPGTETGIAPLKNVLVTKFTGPGGIEYNCTTGGGYINLFVYASVKSGHGPRNLSDRTIGFYCRVWTDYTGNAILFRRTASKAVPDVAGDLLPQVTVFAPPTAGGGPLALPPAATIDNACIMLDASDRLYVAFEIDDASGNGTIYETYSDDGGSTWNTPVSIGSGSNPIYGKTDASGNGLRLPARFVPGASDPTTGTIVVTPTPAGLAAIGGTATGSTDATLMQVTAGGGALTPLLVTGAGHDIVQGYEGAARFILVCTVAGESVLSEWACSDELGWSFTRLPAS